jgi:hypothetical protein
MGYIQLDTSFSIMTLYRVGAQMRIEHGPFTLNGIVTRVSFDCISVRVLENNNIYNFDTSRSQPVCIIDGRMYKAREINKKYSWTLFPLSRCSMM